MGPVWVDIATRVEHVGSLLRPQFLRDARKAYARGELTPAESKAAEDRAVREIVAMQEELGLPVVNDGEMRRESFQSELTAACDGFADVDASAWLWGQWHSPEVGDLTITRPEGLAANAPVRKRRNLAAEEFTFLRGCTTRQAKVTLPSPSLFASLWSPQRSTGPYLTLDAFLADVVQVLCEEVRGLVRLGCTCIQLDAPHYPLLIDPGWRAFYQERGWPLQRWLGYGIELDKRGDRRRAPGHVRLPPVPRQPAQPLAGIRRVRRGRRPGVRRCSRRPAAAGIRRPAVGHLRPAAAGPPDGKTVVLGLVTTKTSRIEPLEQIKARLRDASSLIDAERLALSPQCGFATSVAGNPITPEAQTRQTCPAGPRRPRLPACPTAT